MKTQKEYRMTSPAYTIYDLSSHHTHMHTYVHICVVHTYVFR